MSFAKLLGKTLGDLTKEVNQTTEEIKEGVKDFSKCSICGLGNKECKCRWSDRTVL